jgi:hypothetical protein
LAESHRAGQKRLRVRGSDERLKNGELARLYVQMVKSKFGTLGVDESTIHPENGLTPEDVARIVGGDPKRRFLTDVFTQGAQQYREAGGTDIVVDFALLEASLWDQIVWGNPTAVRNELFIGRGKPERSLGIGLVYKYDGTLYYDPQGNPMPSFSGAGFRDPGFRGTAKDPGFLNVAAIQDETLRGFLKLLHDSFKTPTLIIGKGAEAYWANMEEVNSKIREGLDEAIKDDLEEAIKVLIGFMLWRAVSMALTRQPHPWLKAIGAGMEALAIAAGYALDIEFLGSTEEKLVKAGFHLAKVVPKNDKGEMDEISKLELFVAAGIIRPMVAQIATMLVLKAGEKVARGPKPKAKTEFERVTKEGRRSALECTFCEIRPPRDRPVLPYISANRRASGEEIRLGRLLDRLAQQDALPGARRVVGAPESRTQGVRSGDFRFQAPDGRLIGADAVQPAPTTSDANVWSRVTEKATQAPIIVVELPPGSVVTDAQAIASAQSAANHGTRLQRVIYVRDGRIIADAVRDGSPLP